MTNAYPETPNASGLRPASPSGSDSSISLQKHEHFPEINARNFRETQTLLKSTIQDGRGSLSGDEDTIVAKESDEDGDYNAIMSRVTSLSKSYTVEEEKAIVGKFDRRVVLFMSLLYMLSFLDRSNIGNARIAGLETSLSLQPGQYAWLLTAFYITYISFEWMTLLYRVIPPHIYITLCVLSWGLIASLQSVSTSFSTLIVFRALLGVAEAAFGPGVPFYLSFFYKRTELAYRVGLFISAAPLATSCASTLAWVIVKLFQHGPLEPWRALFLIEGFPSIIVAVFAWHIIPDSPSSARFLTPRERKVAKLRLQPDEPSPSKATITSSSPTENTTGLSLTDLIHTLLTPTTYLTPLMFFSANISFSSLPVFLPTILHSMSLSPLLSQLLSAPPYLISFIFVLLISHLSDRHPNSRSTYIILTSLLSSLSYTSIALAGYYHSALGPTFTLLIRYVGVFGAAMGFFAAITLIITWTLNNQPTATGKGTGMALLNVVGQCGPLVGTHLYPEGDAPYFVRGMLVCAGFMLGCAGLAAGLRQWLGVLNRRAEMEERKGGGERAGSGDDGGQGVEMEDLVAEREDEAEGLMGGGGKNIRTVGRESRFMYVL